MKRIIAAVLSTLVLSTLVSPGAKATRPELLPQRVHPTISSDTTVPNMPTKSSKSVQQQTSMSTQRTNPEMFQPQQSGEPSFDYFEEAYRENYGT